MWILGLFYGVFKPGVLVFAGWLGLIESSSLSCLKPTFFNDYIYLYVCLFIYFNCVVYCVYIMWKM